MNGLRLVRKSIVAVIGGVVLAAGIALIFLPGPAFILIPLGVAILALEFDWAKKLLRWMKQKVNAWRERRALHRGERY